MPYAPASYCSEPRCHRMAGYKGRCAVHAAEKEQQRYNVDTRKWYSTEAWQTLRMLVFIDQPICVSCQHAPSTEVDHIIPHRSEYGLFFNRENLQGMCKSCHSTKTRRGE